MALESSPSLAEYLRSTQSPKLHQGIARVGKEFPAGVIANPPIDRHHYYTQGSVQIGHHVLLTCAPSAVLNSILALGIHPQSTTEMLSKRLYGADLANQQANRPPFLLQMPGNEEALGVTNEGMEHIVQLATLPSGRQPLPIKFFSTRDMGIVHQALFHGYTGVVIDQQMSHAYSLVGAKQNAEEILWFIVLPNELAMPTQTQDVFVLAEPPIIPADPNSVIARVISPVWLITHESNNWEPKEEKSEDKITMLD